MSQFLNMKTSRLIIRFLKDKLGQELIITPEMQIFDDAAKAYKDKFGVKYPSYIGGDDITTDILLKAVAENKEIEEPSIPYGAVS
jgi:hypothetical protein